MYNHKEAFCIMTYRCKDCGFEERIWNSRDGVTPFGLACPHCKGHNHYHEDWQNDPCNPLFRSFMRPGQRYFISLTMERARERAVRLVDHYIEIGELQVSNRNYVIGQVAKIFYQDGQAPDIAVHQ